MIKTWSRKENCPSCGAGCGTKHQIDCAIAYSLPSDSKRKKKKLSLIQKAKAIISIMNL